MAKGYISNRQKNLKVGISSYTENQEVLSVVGKVGIGTVIDIVHYDTQNNGTLSWEASEGTLFSISNNLSSGSIFSVNPISGIPIIDVNADRTIALNPYGGNTGIGTTNPTSKLSVVGDGNFTGVVTASGFSGNASSATYATSAGIATYATSAGIATYSTASGVSTSVSGGIASVTQLNVTGVSTFQGNVYLGDNDVLNIGDSNDLQIYHTGTDSFIDDVGSGNLNIRADNQTLIRNASGSKFRAKFGPNSVELYYNNSKKFETTGAGVTISGIATATTFQAPGGTYASGTDTKTDAALVIDVDSAIYTEHDGQYLRTLLENQGGAINIGQSGTAFINSVNLYPGASGATNLYHGGANKKLQTTTSGIEVTGTLNVTGVSTFQGNVNLGDNDRLRLGDSNDLQIYHDGSASYIADFGTGTLQLISNGTGVFIAKSPFEYMGKFNTDGAVELYYDNSKKFETTGYGVTVSGGLNVTGVSTFQDNVNLGDNDRLIFGAGNDLEIYSDGDNSFIKEVSGTGSLTISGNTFNLQSATGEAFFVGTQDAAVELYYNNLKKFETTGYGATVFGVLDAQGLNITGVTTFQGNVHLGDSDILYFGDGDDLAIYHNGSNSFISDAGTGNLALLGNNEVWVGNTAASEYKARFITNGAVELYYDNSKKFETTGIGVSISNGTSTTATIAGPAELVLDPAAVGDNTGLVRIKGDLYVDGTQTIINSTTIELADFIVGIASTATTDSLADGAGIQIGPDNTFLYQYNSGNDPSLQSSENLSVATGKVYQIGTTERLSANTLSLGTGTTIHSPSSNVLSLGVAGKSNIRVENTGDVTLNLSYTYQDEGILKFGRQDEFDRSHFIRVYNSSTTASNYMKFDVHDGVVGSSKNVLTLLGNGNVGIGTDTLATSSGGSKLEAYSSGTSNTWRSRITSAVDGADKSAFIGVYGTTPVVAAHNRNLSAWETLYVNAISHANGGNVVMKGDVGIGTAIPTAKLDVNGSFRSTGTGTFQNGNSTYGTSTALSAEFGVNTSAAGAIKLHGTSSGAYGLIQATTSNLHIDTVVGGTYLNYYDGSFISFGTGATAESARFTGSTGTLTIGSITETGTASQRLQVTGGAYVSGNLGVGVTNPASNTQVAIAGTLGISEVGGYGTRTLFTSSISGFTLNHNDNSQITFQTLGVNRLTYSHFSNFWTIPSGTPFLVGTGTSTGTASQSLQVNGGAYVSGNLGIGATQPTATLDVAGNASISGIVTATAFSGNVSVTQTSVNGTYYPVLVSSVATGNRTLYVDNGQIAYNPSTNTLDLFNLNVNSSLRLTDNVELYFGTSNDAWFNYNSTGNYLELQLESAATDFRITDNGTERFRFVKSTGSLGIGTTNPTYKLHINDTASSGAGLLVQGGGGGAPLAKFERTVGSTGSITINSSGGDPQVAFSANNVFSLGVNGSNFEICDNGTIGTNQRFVIDSSGNVGIGTDTPAAKLDVDGTLNVSGVSTFQGNVNLGDNDRLRLGDGQDLQIYHDGSNSYIDDLGAGELYLRSSNLYFRNISSGDIYASFLNNSAVSLYYDNSKKFETTADGILVSPNVGLGTTAGNADATQDLAVFQTTVGNTSKLRIVEERDIDGSDWFSAYTRIQKTTDVTNQAYIQFNGSDNTYGMEFGNAANGEVFAQFRDNSSVDLFYNGVKKFETTGAGATVFGTLQSQQVNISGVVTATSFVGDGSNITGISTLNIVDYGVGLGGGGGASISTTAPSSPTEGDLWYNSNLGRTFIYYDDGSSQQWVDVAPFNQGGSNSTVIVSSSAPTSPAEGQLWYNTTLARTFIYYGDGSSSQWVDSAPFNTQTVNKTLTIGTRSTAGTLTLVGTGITISLRSGVGTASF